MIQVIASLTINPDVPEALETHFQVAMPLIERAGGKAVQKIEVGGAVIDQQPSEMLLLVEYPSEWSVQQVFDSEEYKSIIPVRDKAFLTYNVCYIRENEMVM